MILTLIICMYELNVCMNFNSMYENFVLLFQTAIENYAPLKCQSRKQQLKMKLGLLKAFIYLFVLTL